MARAAVVRAVARAALARAVAVKAVVRAVAVKAVVKAGADLVVARAAVARAVRATTVAIQLTRPMARPHQGNAKRHSTPSHDDGVERQKIGAAPRVFLNARR